MTMRDAVYRLARRLRPLRPLLLLAAAAGGLGAGIGLFAFSGNAGDVVLMPGLILLLWALTLLVFIDVFAHLPGPSQARATGARRPWLAKLLLGLHWLLVLGFVALGLTVVDLSQHILDTWLGSSPD